LSRGRVCCRGNNDLRSKYWIGTCSVPGYDDGDGSCGTRGRADHQVHNIDTELLNWLNEFVGVMTAIWCWTRGAPGWLTRIDGGKGPTRLNAVRSLLKEVGLFGQNTFTKGCTRSSGRVAQGVAAFLSGYFDTMATTIGPGHGYVAMPTGPCWRIARPAGVPGVTVPSQEIKAPSVTTMKKNGEMCQLTGW